VAWVELAGAANVRDLGGLPTEDGGKTAEGRLLRSGSLQELSQADMARLVHSIGLTTVVDLRSTAELAAEGPTPLDGVVGVRRFHHPVLSEHGLDGQVVAEVLAGRPDEDRSRYPQDPRCGHYLGYLEGRPEQVVGALRSVARSPGAALIHCAAGKDRTGVVVALALRAVGVCPQAVVADYAASAERIRAVLDRLRRSATYAGGIEGTAVSVHEPRAETMVAFLEQMGSRYGGTIQWLAAHGFGQDDLDLLHAKLRTP
jgi:hypothetical protein